MNEMAAKLNELVQDIRIRTEVDGSHNILKEDEFHRVNITTEWVPNEVFGDSVDIHVDIITKAQDPNSSAYQGILLELVPEGQSMGRNWVILSRTIEGAWFRGSYFGKVEPARYSLRLVDPNDQHWIRLGIPNPDEQDRGTLQ